MNQPSVSWDGISGYVSWLTWRLARDLFDRWRDEPVVCPMLSVLRGIVPEVRRKTLREMFHFQLPRAYTTSFMLTFLGVPLLIKGGNGQLPKTVGFDRTIIYTWGLFHCLNARGSPEYFHFSDLSSGYKSIAHYAVRCGKPNAIKRP